MHHFSGLPLVGLTKHEEAGTVVVIVAIAVLVWGGLRVAMKAAKALLLLLLGVAALVLAVLLFARVI